MGFAQVAAGSADQVRSARMAAAFTMDGHRSIRGGPLKPSRIGQIGVPAAVVCIVVMMVVPLPPMLLDLLITVNLAGAVLILLSSMYVQRTLDFSVFPSLLLIATMFRLALNVSSVRLILLHAYAGNVIQSFGDFVVGGSVVVGLVVFLILIVIQFIVITNGAARVAEVGARFTLDAMPGKQMAIDADLNSGLISEEEARTRRREVAAEADFYGAMDGASKFVKGDAVAAIVITAINLVGGFVTGVVQHGMSLDEAMQTYSLLSVGDGLVSQIPALLISIASGLIVTRAATEADMGSDILMQFGRQVRAMRVGSICVALMAAVPGLPKVPFLVVGGLMWFAATRISDREETEADVAVEEEPAPAKDTPEQLAVDMRVDPLELEIGYGLMDLVDPARGGDLLDRVRALRRKVAMDLGVVIPPVRTRDNIDLPPNSYVVKVHGVAAGKGEAPMGSVLVLGDRLDGIPGEPTLDPVFGLEAMWVPAEFATQAELQGATVVDRGSVITAHLAEVVRVHAARLLSRQDVKLLVDAVKASDPIVTDELGSAGLALADVQRVLQLLLDEQVPVRDLVRILEVLSERARITKDHEALTEATRAALGPAIATQHAANGRLPVVTLDPLTEQMLVASLRASDGGVFITAEAVILERIVLDISQIVRSVENKGDRPVILCSNALRPALRKLLRASHPDLPVLAFSELGAELRIDNVGVVNGADTTTV